MSENYLVSSGFCLTHRYQQPTGHVGGCGFEGKGIYRKECVFEAVPVKQSMSEQDFNELRDILLEASGVFLEYALIHNQKGNDDKSTRNNILSEKQDRALKLLRKIYQTRTFTKEDVEKALLAISEVHSGNRDEGELIAKTALNAVGRVEE